MSIFFADHGDVPALVRLINSAYRGEKSKKGWTTEADLLDGKRTDEADIADLMSEENSVMLKYRAQSGEIIGSVYLQKQHSRLYLGMLSVSPDLQGIGIGKRLMEAAEEYAKKNQCSSVFMTVISVRQKLIVWYERHGYIKTGERKPFPIDDKFGIQKQPLELIVLEKKV